jgi:D-alanyl-D-alanine carboxypeptidase (penicillin-binding protein 5/6)
MHDFPEFVGYYAIKKYRYPGTPVANESNRNLLLFRDPTVDGLKTGHTDAAGFCMIATAKRDVPGLSGRRLLSIVLGASSENARAVESQKLLNWGFTAFETLNLFNANQAVFKLKVWKGKENELSIGKTEPIVIAVPAGQASMVSSQIEYRDPLVAPIQKGEIVAKMKLKLGAENFSTIELGALQQIDQASIFGRAWDTLRLWIK